MNFDCSVIIVSYNTRDLTLQTIESIITSNLQLSLEIIVVDNNSSDGTVAAVRKRFPAVKLLAQTTNLGFGGGNNLGARNATSPYLAFFNSDLITNPMSIAPLIDYIKAQPHCGIVAPKVLLDDSKTVQPASFGAEPTLGRLVKRRQQVDDSRHHPDKAQEVDWVTGAAFVIRRDLFDTIGGFDEHIFMYYEDVDLCHRVRDKGFKVIWLPDATVIHLGGKSSTSTWQRKKRYYNAQMYYTKKHYGRTTAGLLWLLRLPRVLSNRFKT